MSAIVARQMERPVIRREQGGGDSGGREERTPARGIEVTSDTVVCHHASWTDIDTEFGVPERPGLDTAAPVNLRRRDTRKCWNLEFTIGVRWKRVGAGNAITTKSVDMVDKRRRFKSEQW